MRMVKIEGRCLGFGPSVCIATCVSSVAMASSPKSLFGSREPEEASRAYSEGFNVGVIRTTAGEGCDACVPCGRGD